MAAGLRQLLTNRLTERRSRAYKQILHTVHCQAHNANAYTLLKSKFCFPDGGRASQIVHSKRRSNRCSVWSFWSEQCKAVYGRRHQTVASTAQPKLPRCSSWSKQTCALKRQSNCCHIAQQLLHIRSNVQLQVEAVNWLCLARSFCPGLFLASRDGIYATLAFIQCNRASADRWKLQSHNEPST